MSYLIKTFALTTTAQVVVSADVDVDRKIYLSAPSVSIRFGFDTTDYLQVQGQPYEFHVEFVLPAGKDLYAWTATGTANLGVIATKVVE
jgi:hypothetical protein